MVFKYSCWTETSPALSHQCVVCCLFCLFVLFVCLFVCLLLQFVTGYRFFGLQFVLLGCFVCLWLWWWCCLFTVSVYSVTLHNCSPPPQGGLNAVLRLLDWSWSWLTKPSPQDASLFTQDPQHLAFVAKAALGLLKTYILEAYPEKGRVRKPALDCPELAAAVFETRTLLKLILSSRGAVFTEEDKQSPMALVLDACCDTFRMCFNAFYPSIPLKWFALCQHLQYLDPVKEIFAHLSTQL